MRGSLFCGGGFLGSNCEGWTVNCVKLARGSSLLKHSFIRGSTDTIVWTRFDWSLCTCVEWCFCSRRCTELAVSLGGLHYVPCRYLQCILSLFSLSLSVSSLPSVPISAILTWSLVWMSECKRDFTNSLFSACLLSTLVLVLQDSCSSSDFAGCFDRCCVSSLGKLFALAFSFRLKSLALIF